MKKFFSFAVMAIMALVAVSFVSCSDNHEETEPTPVVTYSLSLGGTILDKSTCSEYYHLCLDYTVTEENKAPVTKTIDATNGETLPENLIVTAPATITCKPYFKKIAEPVDGKLFDIGYNYNLYIYALKDKYVMDKVSCQKGFGFYAMESAYLNQTADEFNDSFPTLTLYVSADGRIRK